MKRLIPILLLISFTLLGHAQEATRFVNPFIGTGGHGHTFPGATMPFGMVQLSPDTRVEGWDACAGYHYSDSTILGFSHTHLSGTGVPDYGDILFMPNVGKPKLRPGKEGERSSGYRSRFSHADEQASPGYYTVKLLDPGIRVELTATARTGMHRYTFPASKQAHIVIDLAHGLGPDAPLETGMRVVSQNEIEGYRISAGWAKEQRIFFVARFSKPMQGGLLDEDGLQQTELSAQGRLAAAVRYETAAGEQIVVSVGVSGVDVAGARHNLDAENPGPDFDAVRREAERTWEQELSKIVVEGGSTEQRTVFTTALYHSMIAPNIWSDVDGRYRGMDGQTHTANGWTMYTVFSLWDTFRALHPLLSIIDRARTRDFVRSLIAKGEEAGGQLPVWELAGNETFCMIGNHAIPVIVDAWAKGIRDFDSSKAAALMTSSARMNRGGLEFYRPLGLIPGECESESVSKTLEFAYDDWCARLFGASSANSPSTWLNYFDPSTHLMRPRYQGDWLTPFDPAMVTNHFTEANAWQYSFFVPHAINGLIEQHGGEGSFIAKLDELFTHSSATTGREQSDISGMIGQYAQGNEPSHHVAYLYNYAGAPWKTQAIVRKIMDSLFFNRPDGICGNDDCGQMSAWFVMSALALYQICPGDPTYAIGTPLFPRASIRLENGKSFVIEADKPSSQRKYIASTMLNGTSTTALRLKHSTIDAGGVLQFVMQDAPPRMDIPDDLSSSNRDPYVVSFLPAPRISAPSTMFRDSMAVTLSSRFHDRILYKLEEADAAPETAGSTCTPDTILLTIEGGRIAYQKDRPIVLRKAWNRLSVMTEKDNPERRNRNDAVADMLDRAKTVNDEHASTRTLTSSVISRVFFKHTPIGSITLKSKYQPQYTGGGDQALVDGLRGQKDFHLGAWQGYEKDDLNAVLDLGAVKDISEAGLGCLQDNNAWIFFPTSVSFSFSNDGKTFSNEQTVKNSISAEKEGAILNTFTAQNLRIRARYIRVHAKNLAVCPPWHKGAGGKAWIFADEIVVRTKP